LPPFLKKRNEKKRNNNREKKKKKYIYIGKTPGPQPRTSGNLIE
jgi:hypothetical protein